MKIYDVSRPVDTCPPYPGDPAPSFARLREIEKDGYELTGITATLHAGTHVDAPAHFIPGGKTIGELDPGIFFGACEVIDTRGGVVTGKFVNDVVHPGCSRVLFKGSGASYVNETAVAVLKSFGVELVGTDALSIASPGNEAAVHKLMLGEGIAVIEGLDLSGVRPGRYILSAAPVNIGAKEAAPCRALLMSGSINIYVPDEDEYA